MQAARDRYFGLKILTNATLIDEEAADRFRDLHPISVDISLLGSCGEVHDAIAQSPGAFEKTMRGVELLANRGVRLKLKTSIMKQNLDDYPKIREFVNKNGYHHITDYEIFPRDDGLEIPLESRLNAEEMKRFKEVEYAPGKVRLSSAPYEPVKQLICSAGRFSCTISPQGDLYPCIGIKESLGNVRDMKTFHPAKKHPLMAEVTSIEAEDLEECQGCQIAFFCKRCHAVTELETGSLTKQSKVACMSAQAYHDSMQKYEASFLEQEKKLWILN